MNRIWVRNAIIIGAIFLAGCQRQEQRRVSETARTETDTETRSDTTTSVSPDTIAGTGMVVHLEMEGGFYGIVDYRGERLDVANMPEDFKVDSLRVRYAATYADRMTTRMWGRPTDLITIERID